MNTTIGDTAMASLWSRHDLAARKLMLEWRGQEVARSDGFLVLFDDSVDAIGFAASYHEELRAIDARMQARVGLHRGAVSLRPNSDADRSRGAPLFEIDGVALPVAARVAAAAQPGQTLLTATVAEQLPARATSLKSHGHWRLKGIPEPLELFEVPGANALLQPPPDSVKAYRVVRTFDGWAPASSIPHTLPAERDTFVGRRASLIHLSELFESQGRLITVLGTGGIGKTRLAVRYAHQWLGDYPGGAWFCDLSAARSRDGLLHAVAIGLGLRLGRSDPISRIGEAIAGRGRCLVILDNFEQIADLSESTLGVWLERAAEARFLITSRQLLGLTGEQSFPVDLLGVHEAADLFCQRAQAAGAGDALADASDGAVEALARALEGLPLAIELAAARCRVMSPATLLRRMGSRFELLASRRGRRDRQATLRATLDWSWELLDDEERVALAHLSVFEGGFSLEAAESVLRSPLGQTSAPLDVLHSLIDKSLVRAIGRERFTLLVSVQEYAAERLNAMPSLDQGMSATAAAHCRHWNYYATQRDGDPVGFALNEVDNLIAACRRAMSRGALDDATFALDAAWPALKVTGPIGTATDLVAAIRRSGGIGARACALLHRINGSALYALGSIAHARRELEAGLLLAKQIGELPLQGDLYCSLGDASAHVGDVACAAECFAAAMAIADKLRNPELDCKLFNSMGSHQEALGDLDAARGHYEVALEIAKRTGRRRWQGGSLGNLAQLHTSIGEHREAEPLYEEAILVARELGDRLFEGNSLCNLGLTLQAMGKLSEARSRLDAALGVARHLGQRRLEAVTLCNLGILCHEMNDFGPSRLAFGQAISVAKQLGDRRSEGQFLTYLALLDVSEGDYHAALRNLSQSEALLSAVSDRVGLGIALSCRAEIEARAGSRSSAFEALDRASKLAADISPSERSEFGIALARARSAVG